MARLMAAGNFAMLGRDCEKKGAGMRVSDVRLWLALAAVFLGMACSAAGPTQGDGSSGQLQGSANGRGTGRRGALRHGLR